MYPTIAPVDMTWHCHAFQWLISEKALLCWRQSWASRILQ
jgi:hypothetical protein